MKLFFGPNLDWCRKVLEGSGMRDTADPPPPERKSHILPAPILPTYAISFKTFCWQTRTHVHLQQEATLFLLWSEGYWPGSLLWWAFIWIFSLLIPAFEKNFWSFGRFSWKRPLGTNYPPKAGTWIKNISTEPHYPTYPRFSSHILWFGCAGETVWQRTNKSRL